MFPERLCVKRIAGLVFTLAVLLSSYAFAEGPQSTPSIFAPSSTPATEIYHLSFFVLEITGDLKYEEREMVDLSRGSRGGCEDAGRGLWALGEGIAGKKHGESEHKPCNPLYTKPFRKHLSGPFPIKVPV